MTFRDRLAAYLDRASTRNAITGVILFNAALLGLETSDRAMAMAGTLIRTLDVACLSIFVVEILAKLFAHGTRFFRSGWSIVWLGSPSTPSRKSGATTWTAWTQG